MSRPAYTGYIDPRKFPSPKKFADARAKQDEPLSDEERGIRRKEKYPPIPKYTPIPPLLDGVPDVGQPQPFWLTLFSFVVCLLYVLVCVAFFVAVAWLLISWACDAAGYDFVPLAVFGY